jgi:oxalate decarboxylase
MNNVPDPLLSGKDLPTFKFALEKSKAKVIGKSTAREATVEQLPISKGIAGVSMQLEPNRQGRQIGAVEQSMPEESWLR